ncbi:hypothetical protein DAEQUDRAFT_810191 [Daedalea quercina L-15889]|uniref:Uncharacterized protein n=1 Tax=Daedalea quercina L-15889 TaxID=1314783 RepID=A0A165RW93_9APHY|nr:hypothetical protein DAEQUDRAFT_810191 [Daedalea quercina L-15889]
MPSDFAACMNHADPGRMTAVLAANLASFCIESLLCGVFDFLTIVSIYLCTLRTRQHPARSGRPELTASVIMACGVLLLAVTAHWILSVCRLFLGLGGRARVVSAAAEYFSDTAQPVFVAEVFLVALSILLADAILVFRLWIVWSRNRIVVVPPLCGLVILLACGVGSVYSAADKIRDGAWTMAGLICTLCTTLYCSCMIAGKLIHTQCHTQRAGVHLKLFSIVHIFIESAAFYTAWTLFFIITFGTRSPVAYVGVACLPATAGVACTLINFRICLGRFSMDREGRPGSATWEQTPQFTTWIPEWVSETCDGVV